MKKLFCLIFLTFFCLAYQTELPKDLLKSHFDGRSGDILLYNKESNPLMGSVAFYNAPKFPTTSAIPETEVADLISHFNGLSPFQPDRDRSHFPPSNFFSRPKANLFFYFQNPSTFALSSSASQTFSVSREAYYSATSQLPQLTSMLSGVTPSTHGVISDNFVDRIKGYPSSSISHSYDSWTQGISYSANLADLWTLNYNGKALVMSFSDCKSVSRVLNAKPFVIDDQTSGNFGYYLKHDTLETIYDNKPNALLINKDHIRAFYENNAPLGLSFDDPTEFKVLAEIAIPQMIVRALTVPGSEYAKYTRDEIPDLYSFGFISLKKFGEKHGFDSEKMKSVVELVQNTIENVMKSLNQVYGENSVMTEVVTVATNAASSKSEPASIVKQELRGLVDSNCTVKQLLPNIYLNERVKAEVVSELCVRLSKALEGKGYEAIQMPAPQFLQMHQAARIVEDKRQASNDTGMSHAGVLQTCLWTGIGLGLAAVSAAYFMYSIDPSTDPVLYSRDINHPTAKGF